MMEMRNYRVRGEFEDGGSYSYTVTCEAENGRRLAAAIMMQFFVTSRQSVATMDVQELEEDKK